MSKHKKILIIIPLILFVAIVVWWFLRSSINPEITYKSRQYGPSHAANQTINEINAICHCEIVPTGQYLKEREIYIPNTPVLSPTPTGIFLKNSDSTFESYELSGGP